MNAYTTMGQARIQQRDIATFLGTHSYLGGASLAALERQRGWQAEAEVAWLLKQHGVVPASAASLATTLRQAIGAALVRAGERFAGVPRRRLAGNASRRGDGRRGRLTVADRAGARNQCGGSTPAPPLRTTTPWPAPMPRSSVSRTSPCPGRSSGGPARR